MSDGIKMADVLVFFVEYVGQIEGNWRYGRNEQSHLFEPCGRYYHAPGGGSLLFTDLVVDINISWARHNSAFKPSVCKNLSHI